ncbi:MAG: hypothetical protein ACR2G3_12550 [Solirubrobacterales bacterium]
MFSKLRSQLTYANVMATIAVFMALGGTAWAALANNSVKSKHIAPDAAQGVDVDEASLDTSVLQSRVGGVCQEGQAIQSVLATGQVTCETALQGQPGADGVSFIWQGPWEAGREYAPNDVVSHQGSSWIAKKHGAEPCEPGSADCAQWELLAQKGEQGEQGLRGEQGLPGAPGSDAQFNGAWAGGDLDGTYPDPILGDEVVGTGEIAPDAVGADKILGDAVGSDEINDDAVGTTEVAPNSLDAFDLAPSSVGTSEIADNSISRVDFAPAVVGSDQLRAIVTVQASKVIPGGGTETVVVDCPVGTQLISGGGSGSHAALYMVTSRKRSVSGGANGWVVVYHNSHFSAEGTITGFADCLEL